MLVLNEKEMWQAVTLEEVMEAIEDAYEIHREGRYVMPNRIVASREKNMMLYMPCFLGRHIGTKMLAEFPDNPRAGYPYLSGLMILNDAEHGQTEAIMNGGVLTAMRTGANGGVGIRHLSRPDCSRVGLVGCGTQGLHQILYACTARPITDVYLFDAFVQNLNPFVERLRKRLDRDNIRFHICPEVTELIENSDILISTTQASAPVYPDDEDLLRGKCFIAVGSWMPDRRELPDAVSRLAENIYTEMPYACEESGDLRIPLDNGTLTMDRVKYLGDLIHNAKEGRPDIQGETTCFKTVGMGIFDARVAQLVYENAVSRGIGQKISW